MTQAHTTTLPTLEIVSAVGLITVQDLGRFGSMGRGVPHGGAWVPELLIRANLAAGNAPNTAALEIVGKAVIRSSEPLWVAHDDGSSARLEPNTRYTIGLPTGRRARYLAIHGGIDVPLFLGSRSTLLSSEVGGFEGRMLRHGDRLPIQSISPSTPTLSVTAITSFESWWLDDPREEWAPFDVVLGPDLDRFTERAVHTFLSREYVILASSNRVGLRLETRDGPPIQVSSDTRVSMPMVKGAIEVPSSGQPIVLGPDHPTTGGYPVIAVVASTELGRLFSRRSGSVIRFQAISPEDARRRHRVL
ncbi:MAG: biotin-dependent carboxyltransferase family protein [Polyangiaceae bacterium]